MSTSIRKKLDTYCLTHSFDKEWFLGHLNGMHHLWERNRDYMSIPQLTAIFKKFDRYEKAYDEGYNLHGQGKTPFDCPYSNMEQEGFAWVQGLNRRYLSNNTMSMMANNWEEIVHQRKARDSSGKLLPL